MKKKTALQPASIQSSYINFPESLDGSCRTSLEGVPRFGILSNDRFAPCPLSVAHLAMNPCEDVFRGLAREQADCTEAQWSKYYSRISGLLLGRIDIQAEVPEVKFRDIVSRVESESSEAIKERVCWARRAQLERFRGKKIYANAQKGQRK